MGTALPGQGTLTSLTRSWSVMHGDCLDVINRGMIETGNVYDLSECTPSD